MDFSFSKPLKSFILSPFVLSFPLALLIIIIIPDFFPKYIAKPDESGFIEKDGSLEYYEDIDHDGNSEKIILFANTRNQASIKIVEWNGAIREQYYLKGEMIAQNYAIFFGTSVPEEADRLFVYSRSGDSLFLNVIDTEKDSRQAIPAKFITLLKKSNLAYDFQIQKSFYTDIDGNGRCEFVGGVMAGFSLQPRILFVYNIQTDTLIYTPPMGLWCCVLDITDLNKDGKKEICTMTYSIYNYPDSLAGGFNDHSAWIMVFDHQLNFFMKPMEFHGQYIHVQTLPVQSKSEYYLISLVYQTTMNHFSPFLVLTDIQGRRLKERKLEHSDPNNLYQLESFPGKADRVLLLNTNGSMEETDQHLETLTQKKISGYSLAYIKQGDFDLDGKTEYLFMTRNHNIPVIFREDFSNPLMLEFPVTKEQYHINIKRSRDNASRIFLQQGDNYYLFTYGRNQNAYFKFPFYLGIYLFFLLVILLSQYIQRRVLRQRYDAEKKIAGLQLLLMKNQIDPHFTFNAISSISASILNEKPEEANRNLMALSRLMRSGVMQSGSLTRTLAEELDFLTGYLELMKSRMGSSFLYNLELDEGLDLKILVPGMITQIFAENAIKHGLKPLLTNGKLEIAVRQAGNDVIIVICDNGVGRKAAGERGEHGTGKGISIIDQTIGYINKFNKDKIRLNITDLKNEQGQPAGTRVTISIPREMKYSFFTS